MFIVTDVVSLSRVPPKEKNFQRKQKVQNKLYIITIKIWRMAYKGKQSGNHRPTIGAVGRLSVDDHMIKKIIDRH